MKLNATILNSSDKTKKLVVTVTTESGTLTRTLDLTTLKRL